MYTMDNGLMAPRMEEAFTSKPAQVPIIVESGNKERETDMEF